MQNSGIYPEGVYHSAKTLDLGFGLDKGTYALNFNYNLEIGPISEYTNGVFEPAIKLRLFKK